MTGGCICAICYEDLDAASELLQSIALCGHVFHELCLQQWIEFCPNGRAPTCPLCKQHCGVKDVHRLYFQSDSSLAKKDGSHQSCQKKPSDGQLAEDDEVKLWRLEARVTMLTAECKASSEKILKAESEGQKYLEKVEVLEAEKRKWKKDKLLLSLSQARALEELRISLKHRDELLESAEAMAKEVAVYKLGTDVNLSEVDMSRLISPPNRSASKDDIIDMTTKALLLQNRAFKDLMHKCQELGMGESRAEQKCQKLMEQVKRMKARMQEMAKAEEEKENATVRSLTRTRIAAETTRRPGLSLNELNYAHLANASERTPLLSSPDPKSRKVGDSEEASSLVLASVPPDVICLVDDSEAQAPKTQVNKAGCATQSFDHEFISRKRIQKRLSQPARATIHISERRSQSFGAQTEEDFALRTTLRQCADEGEFYQGVGCSGSRLKPRLTIGLDGDIDDVDALRRGPILPIRQELGLGQGVTAFTRPQSATGFQMPATTDQTVTPESRFILSGADGRGGRVRVLKPPRLVPGGGSSSGSNALGVRGKRFKPTSHSAGARPSALKIEHFFGRE